MALVSHLFLFGFNMFDVTILVLGNRSVSFSNIVVNHDILFFCCLYWSKILWVS